MFDRWKARYIVWKMKESASGRVMKFMRRYNVEYAWNRYRAQVEAAKREEFILNRIEFIRHQRDERMKRKCFDAILGFKQAYVRSKLRLALSLQRTG